MNYGEEVVKRVAESVRSRKASAREIERTLGISRRTVGRWVRRIKAGLPARLSRSAKRVWNRTEEGLLERLRALLGEGKSAVTAWIETKQRLSLRTVQRWKARWFPVKRERKVCKRYERRKALSLAHTDWAEKRILGGKRMCFTFLVDDATRLLSACKAYPNANQLNTADVLWNAVRETGGFRQVLTDCGKVYSKAWGELCRDVRVKPVHTRPYNPQCNGKAEAVVKKAKKFLSQFVVGDLDHANHLLGEFQRQYSRTPHGFIPKSIPLPGAQEPLSPSPDTPRALQHPGGYHEHPVARQISKESNTRSAIQVLGYAGVSPYAFTQRGTSIILAASR